MIRLLTLVVSTLALGAVGFYVGYYARPSVTGTTLSTFAGGAGGLMAAGAAIGVVERYRRQRQARDAKTPS